MAVLLHDLDSRLSARGGPFLSGQLATFNAESANDTLHTATRSSTRCYTILQACKRRRFSTRVPLFQEALGHPYLSVNNVLDPGLDPG